MAQVVVTRFVATVRPERYLRGDTSPLFETREKAARWADRMTRQYQFQGLQPGRTTLREIQALVGQDGHRTMAPTKSIFRLDYRDNWVLTSVDVS